MFFSLFRHLGQKQRKDDRLEERGHEKSRSAALTSSCIGFFTIVTSFSFSALLKVLKVFEADFGISVRWPNFVSFDKRIRFVCFSRVIGT